MSSQSKITKVKKKSPANEIQDTFQGNDISEYHKLEIQEIYERTRLLENLRIQLAAFAPTPEKEPSELLKFHWDLAKHTLNNTSDLRFSRLCRGMGPDLGVRACAEGTRSHP